MKDAVAIRSFASILAVLSDKIGEERYNIWFASVRLISLYRGVVTIGVPNLVYRDWIHEHYLNPLGDASEIVVGSRLRFEVKVDPELFRDLQDRIETETLQELLSAAELTETEGRGLDDFIRLPENETAYRAVRHLVRNESFAFNPLYILGPAGCGKTHLLRGFKHYEGGIDPKKPTVLYMTAQRFTNAYTMSLKKKEMPQFRERFMNVDVVVFDEVHRYRGRKSTQLEFLSVLKDLLRRGVQVVMAGRHHPREIYEISDTFKSNLLSGMMVNIDPYSSASLQKIVSESLGTARRKSVKLEGPSAVSIPQVPRDVLKVLSTQVGGNVSLLLSRLDRLYSLASAKGVVVDQAFTREHIREIAGTTGIEKEVEGLVDAVCGHFGVDHAELMSKRKLKRLLVPRAVVAVVMRDHMRLGFKRIGQLLGGRSHSAVHAMIEKYRELVQNDTVISEIVARLPIMGIDAEVGDKADSHGVS